MTCDVDDMASGNHIDEMAVITTSSSLLVQHSV